MQCFACRRMPTTRRSRRPTARPPFDCTLIRCVCKCAQCVRERVLSRSMLCTQCSLTGADEAFKKVSAAYACLSDADKRRSYDTWGTEDRSQMGGFQGFRGSGGDVDAEELFRAFFAQAGRPGGGAGAHFFNFGAAGAGGGRGGGHGAGEPGGFVRGGGGLVSNLLQTFVSNPWTLLTALVIVASVASLIEAVLSRPYLLLAPFVVPAEYRKHAAMLLFALLSSGVLI